MHSNKKDSEDKFYIENYESNELSNIFEENEDNFPPNPFENSTEDKEKYELLGNKDNKNMKSKITNELFSFLHKDNNHDLSFTIPNKEIKFQEKDNYIKYLTLLGESKNIKKKEK